MNVLLTGGTGFLGRAIARALASAGHRVTLLVRPASRTTDLPAGVQTIPGDVRDREALGRAASGQDALVHTAGLVKVWVPDRREFDRVNVEGLENALAAAEAARLPRIVYTSSFIALDPSDRPAARAYNDYHRTKLAADRIAAAAIARGVPLVATYPGVVYGPGDLTEGNLVVRMIVDHLNGRLPGIIGADRRWSYTYVDDVAAGHVAALERGTPGSRYQLCGENATLRDVFTIVRELTGAPVPRRIPFALASALGAIEEVKAAMLGRPPLLTRGVVDVFRHEWAYDSDQAVRELGYRITPLREGLRRTIDWLLELGLVRRRVA